MKEINCNLVMKDAGNIDYNKTFDKDTLLSKECLERVNKHLKEKTTGVLKGEIGRKYFRNLKKKEDTNYISLDEQPKKPRKPREVKPINPNEPKKRTIVKKLSKREQELLEYPELRNEVVNDFGMNLDKYSQAQIMSNVEWITKYGKVGNKQVSNIQVVKNSISRLPANSFGSIGKYDIDTLPDTLFKCKGTEVTEVRADNYMNKGKHLISRTTATNILSYWCYVLGIRYLPDSSKPDVPNGLGLWSKEITYSGLNGEENSEVFISGNELKQIILDLIYLTRNNNPKHFYQNAKTGKISVYLYNTIRDLRYAEGTTRKKVVNNIKERLYYTHQIGEFCWAYPKYPVDYLIKLLQELTSGKYFMDIYIPLVKDRFKYPIECKDTRVFPMSNEQHKKHEDDYNIGQYIFERD